MKQTKTRIPEGVTRVRNAVTGEIKYIALPIDEDFDKHVNQTLSNLYKGSKRKL